MAAGIDAQIREALGETAAADAEMMVAGLPDDLAQAMRYEMGSPYVARQPAASPQEIQQFRATGAGQILADKWGAGAGRRLGIAKARIARFEDGLSDAEFREWQHFWRKGLTAQQRATVLDVMTR